MPTLLSQSLQGPPVLLHGLHCRSLHRCSPNSRRPIQLHWNEVFLPGHCHSLKHCQYCQSICQDTDSCNPVSSWNHHLVMNTLLTDFPIIYAVECIVHFCFHCIRMYVWFTTQLMHAILECMYDLQLNWCMLLFYLYLLRSIKHVHMCKREAYITYTTRLICSILYILWSQYTMTQVTTDSVNSVHTV